MGTCWVKNITHLKLSSVRKRERQCIRHQALSLNICQHARESIAGKRKATQTIPSLCLSPMAFPAMFFFSNKSMMSAPAENASHPHSTLNLPPVFCGNSGSFLLRCTLKILVVKSKPAIRIVNPKRLRLSASSSKARCQAFRSRLAEASKVPNFKPPILQSRRWHRQTQAPRDPSTHAAMPAWGCLGATTYLGGSRWNAATDMATGQNPVHPVGIAKTRNQPPVWARNGRCCVARAQAQKKLTQQRITTVYHKSDNQK